MSVRILVATLLFVTPLTAWAQSAYVGILVGATAAKDVGMVDHVSLNADGATRPGLLLGGSAILAPSRVVSGEVSLMYAQRGRHFSDQSYGHRDYLELAVLGRVTLPLAVRLRPVLVAGIAEARRIGCEEAGTETGLGLAPQSTPYRRPCNPYIRGQWDTSLIAGAGLEYRTRWMLLSAEARYTRGIKDYYPESPQISLETRSFGVLVGLRFHP